MSTVADAVQEIRAFNRDYTRLIGALDYEHRLSTPYSLPEARVLYELARRELTPVTELRRELDMDPGQLSRLLTRAEAAGLIRRERDPADSRRQLIRLTNPGSDAAELLDTRSRETIGALVEKLSDADRDRLLAALRTTGALLGCRPRPTTFRLRPPGPGELGWVVQRHGALYAAEYGWGREFETLVAGVVADYARDHDPAREAGWIAEAGGEPVGCVFCVDEGGGEDGVRTARLRLLLVEPHARGLGIGAALVRECVRFARDAGYRRVVLWTNDVLTSARRRYEDAGFRLTGSRRHTTFGRLETGQDWRLDLGPTNPG